MVFVFFFALQTGHGYLQLLNQSGALSILDRKRRKRGEKKEHKKRKRILPLSLKKGLLFLLSFLRF